MSTPRPRGRSAKVFNEVVNQDGDVIYRCVSKPEAMRVFDTVCRLRPDMSFSVIQCLALYHSPTLDRPDHSLVDLTDQGTKE